MEIEQGGRRELCAHAVQDHNTGDQFIVAVDLSRCQQEPNSLENAYMDVTVCDGRNVWRGEGLTEMDLGTTFPDRMTHALEALVQLQPPSEEYRCHLLRQAGGNLLVEIEWDQRRHGKDLPGLLKFTLNPVPDPELAAVRLLGRLLRECKSLESQAVALAQACKSSEAATERSHAQLAEYCAAKQVKDGEIAAKAIALLLAKVDKD